MTRYSATIATRRTAFAFESDDEDGEEEESVEMVVDGKNTGQLTLLTTLLKLLLTNTIRVLSEQPLGSPPDSADLPRYLVLSHRLLPGSRSIGHPND